MKPEFLERYSRHFPLNSIGKKNQIKLSNKSVLIPGVGGLGTVSSELLASLGIGKLRLVDYDVIELSNLPRQKLYTEEDIGKSKVDVAEHALIKRNPDMEIDSQTTRVDALSSPSLIDGMDVIVDGLDRFSTRKILNREAYKQKIPFVFAGAIAETANIMTFTYEKDKPCLECVIGNVGDDQNMRCEIQGVNPIILHLAAGIQVNEALSILLGRSPQLSGKMMYIDLETLDFEFVSFKKKNDCSVCGSIETGDLDHGKLGETTKGKRDIEGYGSVMITSLCGRDTFIIDPSWEPINDFERIKETIHKKYKIQTEGRNFITFNENAVSISLMKSGVSTIRGAKKSSNALKVFQQLLDNIV